MTCKLTCEQTLVRSHDKTHLNIYVALISLGKVYAVGGHDGNEHLGNMEVFDPLTNKWMMKASMNTKRYTENKH